MLLFPKKNLPSRLATLNATEWVDNEDGSLSGRRTPRVPTRPTVITPTVYSSFLDDLIIKV